MRRPRRMRRWLAVGAALAVIALVVAGASTVGSSAWQARTHLATAADLARQLQQQLEQGETGAASEVLESLQDQTSAARAKATGAGWRVAGRAEVTGNLSALRAVAVLLDDLAHDGLPALVAAAAELDPAQLVPQHGRMDLAALQDAEPQLAIADRAVRVAYDRLTQIPRHGLVSQLESALAELERTLARAVSDTATMLRTATLLPELLGADGLRTYLVLFQNSAEVRATGGMPGAFAVLEADRGAVAIVDQGSAATDLRVFDEPVLPLEAHLVDLYTDRMATYPANINLTPHFPTTAQLAREMYRQRTGTVVDGVLATDPVALSYLLRATGPVEMESGPALTAGNAVRVLLSEAYVRTASKEEQDQYFAAAAASAFDELVGGAADPRQAIAELAKAAGERRILLWSADPAQQRLIADTVLSGELPTDDGSAPIVGVFLNDGSGAKLSYYLTPQAELSAGDCRPDGRRELRLRLRIGSTAPTSGLPPYVLGMGLAGDPYTVRTNVSIFSPAKGALVGVRVDGAPTSLGSGMERERVVGIVTLDLEPGQTRTIEAELLTAPMEQDQQAGGRLWLTPTATPWEKNSDLPKNRCQSR